MVNSASFVKQSLELHLFFSRIMKEHSFFLEVGFTPKDYVFTQQADYFRIEFDRILADVISLSNGVVSPEALQSGEVITPYTLDAERASSYLTGVEIQTNLTQAEAGLMGGGRTPENRILEQRVSSINQKAVGLLRGLIEFKTTILTNVVSCNMFTVNYPLLIDHILREAEFYLLMIQRLQSKQEIHTERDLFEHEVFWNRIMAEHSKFIRGLLDPTENDLIKVANDFGNEFDQLLEEAKLVMDSTISNTEYTEDCYKSVTNIHNFKEKGTQGILECKIKSIIIPLLGDHVLREANHYLRLLKMFQE